ncbi:Nuclear pore complex protein NUP62 [Vitis vinifera]|uniref:Nuclear pore complex protein NUP62 n=1 Tax=Vitis vinifera TaxID=29760 RepID=A0A438BW20_VITVI|nr:Nuclear pore complex protein NUP62 [Vitis vinifera]
MTTTRLNSTQLTNITTQNHGKRKLSSEFVDVISFCGKLYPLKPDRSLQDQSSIEAQNDCFLFFKGLVNLEVGGFRYEQAEFIEREMEQMTEQIKSIIQTLNTNQGGELDVMDGMTPLDVIVRILNNQLSSLMWIDEKAQEFNSRIQKLASQGSTSEHGSMGPKFWMS